MELTIVLSVPEKSEENEILDTLESLPWDYSGVDLIIYSKDTKKIKEIIKESDLESTVLRSEVGLVLCETPEEKSHHTFGLEDTKTEEVMFLRAGDIIEDFQGDLLLAEIQEPVGIPGVGNEGVPETALCSEIRTLPETYRGMIFKAQWLRDNGLTQIDQTLTAKVCDSLKDKISKPNYWGGWSEFDISDSLSVSRTRDDDSEVIKSLEGLWKSGSVSYSSYLRDLMWTRITTSAARIVSSDKTQSSNFQVYLYPANKLTVLS